MKHNVTMEVVEDGLAAFSKRVLANARKLDRGESIEDKTVIYFENAYDMFKMLTTERVRLMRELRSAGPVTITILADSLGRNKRAVSRDIAAMRAAGVLKTSYVTNTGHGRKLLIKPVAKRIELKSTI